MILTNYTIIYKFFTLFLAYYTIMYKLNNPPTPPAVERVEATLPNPVHRTQYTGPSSYSTPDPVATVGDRSCLREPYREDFGPSGKPGRTL